MNYMGYMFIWIVYVLYNDSPVSFNNQLPPIEHSTQQSDQLTKF
jgi:hypothetical protein